MRVYLKNRAIILTGFVATLCLGACGSPGGKGGAVPADDRTEAWVCPFSNTDEKRGLLTEGNAILELHHGTDSMYVSVTADIKHDFGTVAAQCLVPGTFFQEEDSLSIAYDDNIKLVFEFKDGSPESGKFPAEKDYRAWFSVLRVFPLDAMTGMHVIISSDSLLVLDSHSKPGPLFEFWKTDTIPSRDESWRQVPFQRDEILAVTNMSKEEFWKAFTSVFERMDFQQELQRK